MVRERVSAGRSQPQEAGCERWASSRTPPAPFGNTDLDQRTQFAGPKREMNRDHPQIESVRGYTSLQAAPEAGPVVRARKAHLAGPTALAPRLLLELASSALVLEHVAETGPRHGALPLRGNDGPRGAFTHLGDADRAMRRLREWMGRHWLGLILWTIFVVSAYFMVRSSSDRLPAFLHGTRIEPWLSQFSTGNQITFDVTVGIIVSLVLYVLVVWLPERSKRRRVRRNLELQYDSFKEECIRVFLLALGGGHNEEQIRHLKDRHEFRRFFEEPHSPGQNRWHAVLNGLDDYKVKSLVVELEILMTEVHFTLNTIDIDDPEAFAFLKRLSQVLYRSKLWTPEYDDVKRLSGFMWSVHTGWNIIDGYTDRDPIAEMIQAI